MYVFLTSFYEGSVYTRHTNTRVVKVCDQLEKQKQHTNKQTNKQTPQQTDYSEIIAAASRAEEAKAMNGGAAANTPASNHSNAVISPNSVEDNNNNEKNNTNETNKSDLPRLDRFSQSVPYPKQQFEKEQQNGTQESKQDTTNTHIRRATSAEPLASSQMSQFLHRNDAHQHMPRTRRNSIEETAVNLASLQKAFGMNFEGEGNLAEDERIGIVKHQHQRQPSKPDASDNENILAALRHLREKQQSRKELEMLKAIQRRPQTRSLEYTPEEIILRPNMNLLTPTTNNNNNDNENDSDIDENTIGKNIDLSRMAKIGRKYSKGSTKRVSITAPASPTTYEEIQKKKQFAFENNNNNNENNSNNNDINNNNNNKTNEMNGNVTRVSARTVLFLIILCLFVCFCDTICKKIQ